jgi:hypothetical protein
VKLLADTEIAAWLATRPAIEWDVGNSAKSETKHGFSTRRGDRLRPISCGRMRTKEKEADDAAT